MDSKNAYLHSNIVASSTKDDANETHNFPWSELPHSQQMAYASILDHFKSHKGRNKK